MGYLDQRWGRVKPPCGTTIDWGHPLSKGLVASFLFNEGAGKQVIEPISFGATVAGSPTWKPTELGGGFNVAHTSDYALGRKIINTPIVTLEAWVTMNAYPASGNAHLVGFAQTGAWDKDLYISSSGFVVWYVYDGGVRSITAPSALTLGKLYHLVGTANGTTSYFYVNGVSIGSVAAGGTYSSYANPNIYIGGTDGTGNQDANFTVSTARVWNRALTADEVRKLYERPFDNMTPRTTRKVYSLPSSTDTIGVSYFNQRWTDKPPVGTQLDRSNPLAKGLMGCWLLNEGGGRQYTDIVSSVTASSATVLTQKTLGRYGSGVANTTDRIAIPSNAKITPTGSSLSMVAIVRFSTTVNAYIVSKIDSGSPFAGFGLRLSNTGKAGFWVGGTAWTDGATTIVDSKPHVIVGTYDGTTVKVYVDGKLDASQAQGHNFASTVNLGLCASGSGQSPMTGDLGGAMVFDRCLSPSEVAELSVNPFQIMQPRRRFIGSAFPTPSGTTIVKRWGNIKPPCGVQLDRSHPRTKGLLECVLFNERAGMHGLQNLADPRGNLTTINSVTTTLWTAEGMHVRQSVEPTMYIPNHGDLSNADFTLSMKFKVNSVIGSYDTLISKKTTSTGREQGLFYTGSPNAHLSYVDFQCGLNGTSHFNFTVQQWVTLTVRRRGSNLDWFKNGIYQGSDAATFGSLSASGNLNFGLDATSGGTASDYDIAYFRSWTRPLGNDEILEDYLRPYDICQPFRIRAYGDATGVGTGGGSTVGYRYWSFMTGLLT